MTESEETIELIYYGEPIRSTYTVSVPEWVVGKRKGNRIRWRNRITGAWGPGWYPFIENTSDLQERILQDVIDNHRSDT